MSLVIDKDGLRIEFLYHKAELPSWDVENPYPGKEEEVEIEGILLSYDNSYGGLDLLVELNGEPYLAIVRWAEEEAMKYVKEQQLTGREE